MNLNSKVAVVTGGATGIGRATAEDLTAAGAVVLIGDRDENRSEEVVKLIRSKGGRAAFKATDVSKEDDVRSLVRRAVDEFGRLDLAFNNAGIGGRHVPLADQAQAQFENGVLTLTFPKAEEAKPKQIKVGGKAQVQGGQAQSGKSTKST